MAEDVVVKEQLTDAMIDAGAELIRTLLQSGMRIDVAVWLFMPDMNEWRLMFASPEVGALGSRQVYRRIHDALASLGDGAKAAPLSAIGLLRSSDELVPLLRSAIQNRAGVSRIRFSKDVLDGHYVDDALIYRVA